MIENIRSKRRYAPSLLGIFALLVILRVCWAESPSNAPTFTSIAFTEDKYLQMTLTTSTDRFVMLSWSSNLTSWRSVMVSTDYFSFVAFFSPDSNGIVTITNPLPSAEQKVFYKAYSLPTVFK